MFNDPADETFRKPRRLRNTPLQKYVRLASLAITLIYAGAMYLSWRKNVKPLLNDEAYKASQISEDEQSMLQDYVTIPFLRGTIEKLVERQQAKREAEVEPKDTQTKENLQTT